VLDVSCRHFAAPSVLLRAALINLAAVPEPGRNIRGDRAGPWLQSCAVERAEHTIRAVPADPATAEALACRLARLPDRRAADWSNGAYLTHVRLAYGR